MRLAQLSSECINVFFCNLKAGAFSILRLLLLAVSAQISSVPSVALGRAAVHVGRG